MTVRKILQKCVPILLLILFLTPLGVQVYASDASPDQPFTFYYQNKESSNISIIADYADLISDTQEKELGKQLKSITEYSNIALVTLSQNPVKSAENFAEQYNEKLFENAPGVVFLIDMDTRVVYIDSIGSARKTIRSSYANTITDNIYTYAHDGNYYECARRGLEQINDLFHGRRIAQPMRYVSSALLALVIAVMINFFIVLRVSRMHAPSTSELVDGIYSKCDILDAHAVHSGRTKTYSPRSSGSSGNSGGGGGGGGHSGGGHSF